MKAFKTFKKPFEELQSVKFNLIFSLRPGLGREGLEFLLTHFQPMFHISIPPEKPTSITRRISVFKGYRSRKIG